MGFNFDIGGLRLRTEDPQPDDRIVLDDLDLALDIPDVVVEIQFELLALDVVGFAVPGHDAMAAEGLRSAKVELRELVVFPCSR